MPSTLPYRAPILLLAPQAWQRMRTYAQLSPGEINGFGYVTTFGRDVLYVASAEDVFITRQTISDTTASAQSEAYHAAKDQARQDGKINQLRLQWHSHGDGPVFFSSIDAYTIDKYAKAGAVWKVSLVLNKQSLVMARIDFFVPLRLGVNVPVYLEQYIPQDVVSQCADDVVKLVSQIRVSEKKKQLFLPHSAKKPEVIIEPVTYEKLTYDNIANQHILLSQPGNHEQYGGMLYG